MASRGRLRTACLTAAASASAVASFAAASIAGPADLRMPPRYAGEPLSGNGGLPSDPRGGTVAPRTARPAAPPIYGFPAVGAGRDARPVGRKGAVREYARPASSGWVALVGEFGKQGCHEIPGESMPLAELLRRCEGLRPQATGTIRLVRGGLPAGTINPNTDVRIRPGDLLVADGAGGRRFGGVTTASFERGRTSADRPAGVRLGVVGATERPLSINLDANKATVGTVIAALGQNLPSRDVTVLVGGSVRKRGDEVAQLTDGSVVVFDPRTVDVRQVAASGIESQTHYYPVQDAPSELPPDGTPEAMPAAAAGAAMPVSAPAFSAPSPEAMTGGATETAPAAAMSLVPPPPTDENLSSLPSVEMLAPPADEPPLGYPRTADASGSIPVGPADVAEPHITAVPANTFYGGPSESRIAMGETAAPPVPTDSLGPASSDAPADSAEPAVEEEAEAEDISFEGLAATVLIGGALGAVTFLILRRLRGRGLPGLMNSRLAALVARRADRETTKRPTEAGAETPAAPADMLAALVADRLAFREEPIELPPVLRIFGRSSAMRKRRVDPAAAGVPEPHIPLAAPATATRAEGKSEAKAEPKGAGARYRVDPAETVVPPAGLAGGTPFERALAARHRAAAER